MEDSMKGHHLWGFWNCYIPPSLDTIEFVPARTGVFHLNTRRFLEDTACTDCLKLVSFYKDFDNMLILAQIQITHPFAGYTRYTGFDVRGIVISDGSLYFPTLDARVPYASKGDFTLVNPDGWTRMWNTVDFAPGSGPFPILEYSTGKFATPGNFTATVNPYIEFVQDPRSCFPAGAAMTREFQLTLKPGGAFFGYAIDASWEPPTVDPPIDLMTDFPESANALEPYVLSTYLDQPLFDQVGDTAYLALEMADRQWDGLPSQAYVECPDLWTGTVEPQMWGVGPGEPLWNWLFTGFDITNETGAPAGEYPALIKVIDGLQDPYLGDINHRYELTFLDVSSYTPPDYHGLAVFSAPAPPVSGEPPAPNVFLLDLETLAETQITKYIGIGANFEEPRINAQGNLALLTFCPSPMESHIEVFDIETSDVWLIFASGGADYYGHADFHPDSQHIVVASGSGWGDTPDLISVKYDGTEWEKIATAPGSVTYPRWSPDGNRIAMVISQNSTPMESAIWIYDITTQQFTELLSGEYLIACPSWNPMQPGGQDFIAFQSNMNDPMGMWSDIFVINPDTLETSMIVDSGMDDRHPSFSPGGTAVMYVSESWMGSDLYIYDLQLYETFQITTDDTFDESPCWSWGW